MGCFCPFGCKSLPSHNNTYLPPIQSTPPADNVYPPPLNSSLPPPVDGNRDYEWDTDLLLVGIACIFVAFLVMVSVYYLYARWHYNRLRLEHRSLRRLRIPRLRGFSISASEDSFTTSPREGLRSSMVNALPVFVYQPEHFTDGLRCAVCLCEFEEKEKARQLPSCKHSFHVDCIDMWFYSHSTCPLCRARVDAQPVQMEMSVIEVEEEEEEEADHDKVSMSSTSGSDAEEQHIQRIEKKNDDCWEGEEESGAHAVIDMPTTEN